MQPRVPHFPWLPPKNCLHMTKKPGAAMQSLALTQIRCAVGQVQKLLCTILSGE